MFSKNVFLHLSNVFNVNISLKGQFIFLMSSLPSLVSLKITCFFSHLKFNFNFHNIWLTLCSKMNYINSVKYNFLLRSSNDGWLGVFLFLSHCLAGESSHHSITAHTFQSSEKRSQLSIRYLILTSLSSHFCNISANGRGDEDKITSLQRLWLCLTKTDILSMLCRHRTVTMFLRKWPCMHWAASSLPPPDLPSILTLHFTKTTRRSLLTRENTKILSSCCQYKCSRHNLRIYLSLSENIYVIL